MNLTETITIQDTATIRLDTSLIYKTEVATIQDTAAIILVDTFTIYAFVDTVTADYDYTLSIAAHGMITEEGFKNQVIHRADNNSREVITLCAGSIFFVSWDWAQLSALESGTIFDLYHDSTKANGKANSFKWSAHDGHTYVVAFDCNLLRKGNSINRWGLPGIRLEIIGRIADA